MNEMPPKALDTLTKLLRESKRLVRFAEVRESMLKWLDSSGSDPDNVQAVDRIINEALAKFMAEKVIDYPAYDKQGIPQGKPEWHLKLLNGKEKRALASLAPEESALLRILYSSNASKRIGALREEDALKALREEGFDVSEVPCIEDKVSDYFDVEGGKREPWVYLIPEYEKSAAYRRELQHLTRKRTRQEDREFAASQSRTQ